MNTKFTKDDLIHLSGLFEKQSFDELNAELDVFLKLGDNAILLNLKGATLIAQEKYLEAEKVLDRLASKFVISIDLPFNEVLQSNEIFSTIYFPSTNGFVFCIAHVSGNITPPLIPIFLTGYNHVAS